MTVNIVDILERRHVIPGLTVADKNELLSELAGRAALALKLDANMIATALSERERLGSTGTGNGIAIPHARITGLEAPFALFARVEPPIDFDSIDGKKVDLVFLLLTPSKGNASHLALLAAVSRRLRDKPTTTAIRSAENAVGVYRRLTALDDESPK